MTDLRRDHPTVILGLPQPRPILGSAPVAAAADALHGAWAAFVTDGDPGWPSYERASRQTGLLREDGLAVVADPDSELRQAGSAAAP